MLNIDNIINLLGTLGTVGAARNNALKISTLDGPMTFPKQGGAIGNRGNIKQQDGSSKHFIPSVPSPTSQEWEQPQSNIMNIKQPLTSCVPNVPTVPTQGNNRVEICAAVNRAVELDNGALEHCSHYRPDLQRACIAESRELDDAYDTKDARQVRQAIREHDKACEATRSAAQHPISACKLSPDEVTRFCTAHLEIQGSKCPYKKTLDDCLILMAKNKNMAIDTLEIPPEYYLDLHQLQH